LTKPDIDRGVVDEGQNQSSDSDISRPTVPESSQDGSNAISKPSPAISSEGENSIEEPDEQDTSSSDPDVVESESLEEDDEAEEEMSISTPVIDPEEADSGVNFETETLEDLMGMDSKLDDEEAEHQVKAHSSEFSHDDEEESEDEINDFTRLLRPDAEAKQSDEIDNTMRDEQEDNLEDVIDTDTE
jgi:hypothetical protein